MGSDPMDTLLCLSARLGTHPSPLSRAARGGDTPYEGPGRRGDTPWAAWGHTLMEPSFFILLCLSARLGTHPSPLLRFPKGPHVVRPPMGTDPAKVRDASASPKQTDKAATAATTIIFFMFFPSSGRASRSPVVTEKPRASDNLRRINLLPVSSLQRQSKTHRAISLPIVKRLNIKTRAIVCTPG